MNSTVLRDEHVPYKYTIFSNRLDELNDPFEQLYGVPDTSPYEELNRCLRIPHDKCHPEGILN